MAGCDLCGNTPISEIPSPSRQVKAIVFDRDCGATTDFVTHVSILATGHRSDDVGNTFIADADHGNAPRGKDGGPVVLVHWIDAQTLEIRYHPKTRIYKQERRENGVTVHYVADSTLAPRA
jgi:hypothetical protein